MTAEIIVQTEDLLVIAWSKPKVGFGELTMKWNEEKGQFDLDSELMGVDTVLEIFSALKLKK